MLPDQIRQQSVGIGRQVVAQLLGRVDAGEQAYLSRRALRDALDAQKSI